MTEVGLTVVGMYELERHHADLGLIMETFDNLSFGKRVPDMFLSEGWEI